MSSSVDNGISRRISTSDKHKDTKVYKLLLCACATDAEADQCTTVGPNLVQGLDQNRTAGFSVIDLDGSEI